MDKKFNWFGPLCGILFVVAVFVGGGISGQIDSEPFDPGSSVVAEFRESADDILRGSRIIVLGLGLFLVFVAHVRTKFRDGGAGWAADSFLAGGLALAGASMLFVGVDLMGAEAGGNGHTEVAQAAVDFSWNGTVLFSPGLLALGLSAAIASFAYRALPVWLGVFAVLVALSALVPWIGIFIAVIWVLAASISDLISSAPTPTTADAG